MTNINDALLRAISMLNKAREEHRVPERSTSIVIMLTDGDANVGEAGGSGAGMRRDLGWLSQWPGSPSKAMSCLPLLRTIPLPRHGLVAVTPPALRGQESDTSRQS